MGWIDYDQHARKCDRSDLWGQVRRTVHGVPVGPEQISLIVATLREHLQLTERDVLLDLACGNGALSVQLQPYCRASVGVDISAYLIGVADERFASAQHRFVVDDAAHYVETASSPERFTKALCYGSLSYLSDADVERTFRALHDRFPNVSRVLLGNLPDPSRVRAFSTGSIELGEARSDIGVWRSLADLQKLAGPGWRVRASTMPEHFFAAHYRFDAMLERSP